MFTLLSNIDIDEDQAANEIRKLEIQTESICVIFLISDEFKISVQ